LNKIKTIICTFFLLIAIVDAIAQEVKADDILGNWITPEKDLVVHCYKVNNQYFGKIVWFKKYGDAIPDEVYAVPQEKWLHYVVMKDFVFQKSKWKNGKITEVRKGATYDAYIAIENKNTLNVKGFYVLKFINKSQLFKRYEESKLPD